MVHLGVAVLVEVVDKVVDMVAAVVEAITIGDVPIMLTVVAGEVNSEITPIPILIPTPILLFTITTTPIPDSTVLQPQNPQDPMTTAVSAPSTRTTP